MDVVEHLRACQCGEKLPDVIVPKIVIARTPADHLGFTRKCCYCIGLRPAAYIISFFSFVWAISEFIGAGRQVECIFPDKGVEFSVTMAVYLILCFGLLLATCMLFYGILNERYNLVNAYIWYIILFTLVFTAVTVAGVVSVMLRGRISRRQATRAVAAAVWLCLLVYLILVVNSFKYTLW